MASSALTPVKVVPTQRHRPAAFQPMLSPVFPDDYCRLVDDTPETSDDAAPMTWAQYVTWAAGRAGSVNELAARANLHRGTITAWKRGKKSPDTATVNSIRKVAAAVGDDPRRALRAAGRAALADKEPPPPPPPAPPPLAAQLDAINQRIDAIARLGLPLHEQIAAVETQRALADRIVALYQRAAGDDSAGDNNERDTA